MKEEKQIQFKFHYDMIYILTVTKSKQIQNKSISNKCWEKKTQKMIWYYGWRIIFYWLWCPNIEERQKIHENKYKSKTDKTRPKKIISKRFLLSLCFSWIINGWEVTLANTYIPDHHAEALEVSNGRKKRWWKRNQTEEMCRKLWFFALLFGRSFMSWMRYYSFCFFPLCTGPSSMYAKTFRFPFNMARIFVHIYFIMGRLIYFLFGLIFLSTHTQQTIVLFK